MSRTTHFHPRRALFASAVLLIGLAASGGTAQSQSSRLDRTTSLYSAYVAGFTGLDAAGRDMVWRGAVAGAGRPFLFGHRWLQSPCSSCAAGSAGAGVGLPRMGLLASGKL
jgi:hypothetical protein